MEWMDAALAEARRARDGDEVPVGAVVVLGGRVIASGHNRTQTDADPPAHAEIVALRAAGRHAGAARLPGTTVYVTLEPCLMCLGAMVHARVERLVYAAPDPKVGATELFSGIPVGFQGLNHALHIEQGPLAEESASLLREFFRSRR